ncbi:MAG: hypothetical protein JWM09_760 [Francisellaceae bacterium]|nr:hypothetical protein [Francisellaceae bacterium]
MSNQFENSIKSILGILPTNNVSQIKKTLENLRKEYEVIQKRFGKIDRETFNLDFDLKLLISQADDLPPDDIDDFNNKIEELLPKIEIDWERLYKAPNKQAVKNSGNLNKSLKPNSPVVTKELPSELKQNINSQEIDIEKRNQATLINDDKEKAINGEIEKLAAVKEETLVYQPSHDKSQQADALSQANKYISAEQDIINQLKIASKRLEKAVHEANEAEKIATALTEKAVSHKQKVAELTVEVENAAAEERQEKIKLSEYIRDVGRANTKHGMNERLKSEFWAAEIRIKNGLLEIQSAYQGAQEIFKMLEENDIGKEGVLAQNFEQIKQTEVMTKQATLYTQLAVEQFNKTLTIAHSNLEQSERERQMALNAQRESEKKVLQLEANWLEAQEQLSHLQKTVVEHVVNANEATKQADKLRADAQQAMIEHQKLAVERAQLADNVRVAVQLAGESERSRILAELLAKNSSLRETIEST